MVKSVDFGVRCLDMNLFSAHLIIAGPLVSQPLYASVPFSIKWESQKHLLRRVVLRIKGIYYHLE